ncbi:MAG: UV damage endonuclease UvsE [Oscillochloridaceae bacterium umkhey_bin13]
MYGLGLHTNQPTRDQQPIRLGFAVRALGRPGLAGVGRGRSAPHLSVSLARLGDMLGYLRQQGLGFYRAALPLPEHNPAEAVHACAAQLAWLARQVAAAQIRVTMHLPIGLSLASADPAEAEAAAAQIEATANLLAALDAARPPGPIEGVMVAHLGAAAHDHAAWQRFGERYHGLSHQARLRLALEHEGHGPSLGQLLVLHQACGVPVVFDALHWEQHNPEQIPLGLALGLALATWPATTRPKVHLSSQRSEAHLLPGRAGEGPRIIAPRAGQHADFVALGDLERLLLAAKGLPAFDLMLEAKAGELALLRLRTELAQRCPILAERTA